MGFIRSLRLALTYSLAATALAGLSARAAADAPGADVVEAVWKEQRISCGYRDPTHTCAGLRTQLRSILRALGSRETLTISVAGCDNPAATRTVDIALASAVEATPDNIGKLTTYAPTEELAARVQGRALPDAESLPRFRAQWKTISFANALRLRLTAADCELLRRLRRELMPKMAVRVIDDRLRCPSALGSGHRPQLVVAALIPASDSGIPSRREPF